MKNIFIYFLFISTLSGFTSTNTNSELKNAEYTREIPFNYDYGVPIIKATINDKEYNFLFDTGMPTALSDSIATALNLKNIRTVKGVDVNGNSKQENYVILDEISIGGISFKEIESLAIDLKAGFEIGCLNLDGVIGNNLIKNAIWEIDYKNKIIRLTDNIDNFEIPEDAAIIKFKTDEKRGHYSPAVDIKINKKKRKKVKFDTGSNGALKMPLNFYSKVLDPDKSVEYFGRASASIYGKGENTKYIDSKVSAIEIGGLELQNQIVSFNNNFPTIGNKLFENYRIIINYEAHKIYMIKQKEYNNRVLENFGFQTGVINGKAIIVIVYKDSMAEEKGLQLGDEILEVNEMNQRKLIAEDPCDFLFNNPVKDLDSAKILFLRDGEKQTISLKKETFIE